jgi:hypothetical protein
MGMKFIDGSYIEENKSGLIYVGVVANEVGHILRKTGASLETFKKAFDLEVEKKKLLLMIK